MDDTSDHHPCVVLCSWIAQEGKIDKVVIVLRSIFLDGLTLYSYVSNFKWCLSILKSLHVTFCAAMFCKASPPQMKQRLSWGESYASIIHEPEGLFLRSNPSFKDKGCYEQYLRSEMVTALRQRCEELCLLDRPQDDRVLTARTGFLNKPGQFCQDPYVVLATIRFRPEGRQQGIDMFRPIADRIKRETTEVYSYIHLADTLDETLLWSFERFANEAFLRGVHVKREDILNNMRLQQGIRTPNGLHHWYWKQVGEMH